MDAREKLRRFLEQRREAGETELVFDSLSVEDAMRILGAGTGKEAGPRKPDAPVAAKEAVTTERSVSRGEDWRAILREAGAAPPSTPEHSTTPAPAVASAAPSAPVVETHATMPLDQVPTGIVIGEPGKKLAGGPSPYGSLEELNAAVASCTLCPLYKEAKNPVPGDGNPRAQLVCVGEAPGATEDEKGLPFVGQAGQLLDKILAAIKLSRKDVFICNVLKHRPPANRNPTPDEVQACSPYLLRQLELIQPHVIVAFGTFAAQTLLNTREGIGKLRGKVHQYHGVPLVVTYHPAALLRNPAWKRPAWDDVQLARRLLDRANST